MAIVMALLFFSPLVAVLIIAAIERARPALAIGHLWSTVAHSTVPTDSIAIIHITVVLELHFVILAMEL